MTRRKPPVRKCHKCGTYRGLTIINNKYSCELCLREFTLPEDENWVAGAACRNSSLDFFSDDKTDVFMAKLICSDCPVQNVCLAEAMKRKEQYGVWGGTSEEERSVLFRRWRPAVNA